MNLNPEMQQKLRENVREFLKACSMALKMNKFMSSENDLFHRELSNGYEKLCNELYPYVGAVTGAAGVMGSQQALQTAKPLNNSFAVPASPAKTDSTVPPQTPFRAVVNGYLIPSVMQERRRSRRMKKSGSVSGTGSCAAGSAGNSSTGSARGGKMQKSETFATISLSLAQKRADESADGDPNSLSSVGVATPAPRSALKQGTKRLSVISPAGATPYASSSLSTAMPGGNSTAATPLKARVPINSGDSSLSVDDDTSSVSSIGSDSDDDIVDLPDEDEPQSSKHSSSAKKNGRSHRHHHH